MGNGSYTNGSISHGGKRKGAGRKPRAIPLKTITLRVKPDIAQRFNDMCKLNGLSQSRMFAKLFEAK